MKRNQISATASSDSAALGSLDTGKSAANEIIFTKPLFADPDFIFQSSVYQWDRNHMAAMSFQEKVRGFSAKIKSFLDSEGSITYEAGYDAVWRHNHSISPYSSLRYEG